MILIFRLILLGLSLAVTTTVAAGAAPFLLSHSEASTKLDSFVSYTEITGPDTESIPTAFPHSGSNGSLSLGFSSSVFWLRFDLVNSDSIPWRGVLVVGYPALDDLRLVATEAAGIVAIQEAGDSLPQSRRSIKYHDPAFSVLVPPATTKTFYLRVRSTSSLNLPLVLWQEPAFADFARNEQSIFTTFYGGVLTIVAFNLMLFFVTRERLFINYVASQLTILLFNVSLSGYGIQFLWPNSPWLANTSIYFFGAVSATFFCIFSNSFMGLRQSAPRWSRTIDLFAIGNFGVAALSLFSVAAAVRPFLLSISVCSMGVMICAVREVFRKNRAAVFYCLASGLYLFSTLLRSATSLGMVHETALTPYYTQIGQVIETLLFSLGIGARYNDVKKEQFLLRRKMAEQAAESQRNLALIAQIKALDLQKTAFFRNISHELRTPLTLIMSPLELLGMRLPGMKEVEVASRNARRLLRLVNQLLDFQKAVAGRIDVHLESVDLVVFLGRCASYFESTCENNGIHFVLRAPEKAAVGPGIFIAADPDALEKVVFNYLSNAYKYTPRGGTIELSLTAVDDAATISVRDSGPGISAKGQQMLFQVFSHGVDGKTTKHEGTGIGLALTKELAGQMQGTVGVTSDGQNGSVFWVTFPRRSLPNLPVPSAHSTPTMASTPPVDLSWAVLQSSSEGGEDPIIDELTTGELILVADDNRDMRAHVRQMLRARGYRTAAASNGAEALERIRQLTPDLVVTDWMMPFLSGPELLQAMNVDPLLNTIPVVLLTAKAGDESRALALADGAVGYLGKPFSEVELISLVRNLLRLKKALAEQTSPLRAA